MYAMKKSDLATYTCDSESQCRIEEGNTNPFLSAPRVVEDVLKLIEPPYNSSLQKLRRNRLDSDAITSIVGFASYVEGNSPAGMRLHSQPLKATVESTAALLDQMGRLPKPPPELGADSLTELLKNGGVQLTVDPKYAQSIAVQTLFKRMSLWGNSRWDVLINTHSENPFFTSDYPIGIELSADDNRVLNRIVPLAPDLAIKILPDINARNDLDLGYSGLRVRHLNPSRSEIVKINQTIVRCAETTVYYRDDQPWVLPFIRKHGSLSYDFPWVSCEV